MHLSKGGKRQFGKLEITLRSTVTMKCSSYILFSTYDLFSFENKPR